jgi:hypothetical protein
MKGTSVPVTRAQQVSLPREPWFTFDQCECYRRGKVGL